MEARDRRRMTLAEYVALEAGTDERWEYVDGEVFVLAARPEHTHVKGRVYLLLVRALEGKPCFALGDGAKVSTRKTRSYHYPDASVFCGPLVRDPGDENALENPTVIVEVLSPSTADYDRGGKFAHYRTLASLREYVVVAIDTRSVVRYRRLPSGEWLMTELEGGNLELSSIDVRLTIADLWVDLERVIDQ